MEVLPPEQRDAASRDLGLVAETIDKSVVASTRRARQSAIQKWQAFCEEHNVLPNLTDQEAHQHLNFLFLFGSKYRQGAGNRQKQPVRADTVEKTLGHIAKSLTDLGLPDPRLQVSGKQVAAYKEWLRGMRKEDPASSRVLPCSLKIIEALWDLNLRTNKDQTARRLIVIGFFYMNRPGEVVATSTTGTGRSTPFRIKDCAFTDLYGKVWNKFHPTNPALLNDVDGSLAATLTYTDQKNCTKGEKVSHVRSGHEHLCPVTALEQQVSYLLRNGCPDTTPLYTYFDSKHHRKQVTASDVTNLLRRAAAKVQDQTGIPPSQISARSLRPGGATALLCAGHAPESIALVGRWKSDAILRYLRTQVDPQVKQFAKDMLAHGHFTFVYDDPDGEGALARDLGGIPKEAAPDLAERFDLTGTDDDDDDDDA